MKTTHTLRREIVGLATTVLVSGGLGLAGLGLAAGTAQADTSSSPHQWCPGDSMNFPTGPGNLKVWDMSVCHTWYFVRSGFGNVQVSGGIRSDVWDGENPPDGSLIDCGHDLFGFPIHC
ncbi:hypothetical protein [Mycolicibacterium moriokaense]|uniref:Uncharacterized protein n=1 Tax=Mycolicibacterium moriokaense TaxID=39691 RepID=A0A318H9H4_9MYCO|nr:hypothetical protein [Mycolicibacterium moriokaense]PXW99578.1 hypothetical protein C8E89_1401 [Mycolicibacterium moriokaense]